MPIANLTEAALSLASQIPFGDTTSGNDRRAAVSALIDLIQENLTSAGGFMTQYSAPNATGFSVTIDPETDGQPVHLLLTPAATYAAGTIVMPALAECVDGQEVLVNCTQIVTTLTVSGNGATVNGAPTTLAAANAFFRLKFDGVFDAWYRIG